MVLGPTRDGLRTLKDVAHWAPLPATEHLMSIFGNIMSAIFGKSAGAQTASPSTVPDGAQSSAQKVDVEAILTERAKTKGQKLDWRHSIVDLMKLLDLDSSQEGPKELAKELNYTGDTSDTATMNVWLHKQVMAKLAASGGKLPDDLRS